MTDTYEHEVDVAAPRQRVWRALVEGPELERWFCEHADVDLDAGDYNFWGRYTPDNPTVEEGGRKIIECEPERRLRYAWPWRGGDTTVEVTLEVGDNDATRVHILHEGVPLRTSVTSHSLSHFWTFALTQLRGYLEMGRPGPRFDWSWPHMGGFTAEAEIRAPRTAVWEALVDNGWEAPLNPRRRPPPTSDDDFGFDVGPVMGIKVLDLTAPDRYSLRWDDSPPTVLTYTLEDSAGGTRITIVHSGFADDDDIGGMAEGFFSGIVEIAWQLETQGAWPPVKVSDAAVDQPMKSFGVRTFNRPDLQAS